MDTVKTNGKQGQEQESNPEICQALYHTEQMIHVKPPTKGSNLWGMLPTIIDWPLNPQAACVKPVTKHISKMLCHFKCTCSKKFQYSQWIENKIP